MHNASRTRQSACAGVWKSGSFATKVHACHFMCAAMKNKSAAKRKEHRQGSLQRAGRSPKGLPTDTHDHEHQCRSTCRPPPQYCTCWPRVLSNRKLYFGNSALFSQRPAVCLAMSEQTRVFSNSPQQHEKHHHDDTCQNTMLNLHFLDRSPRCSLFTVVQSGLLEMCGSEPPSLCNSFTSSYCPAPGPLASQNSWLQNGVRAIQCAVVAPLSLVVSSSSSFFTCAQ